MADTGSTMNVVINGTKYAVELDEMTARDARDFRQVTGTRLIDAFEAPDLDHIAAFVWLHRRRTEPKLSLSDVEEHFTLASLSDPFDDDDEGGGDPEA